MSSSSSTKWRQQHQPWRITVVLLVVWIMMVVMLLDPCHDNIMLIGSTVVLAFPQPPLLSFAGKHPGPKFPIISSRTTAEAAKSLSATTTSTGTMDPLLYRVLIESKDDDDDDETTVAATSVLDVAGGSGSMDSVSHGLAIWRATLLKGRLPTMADFGAPEKEEKEDIVQQDVLWPEEPLFSTVSHAMAELQLPRFVLRHPETVHTVLLTLIRMTVQFTQQQREQLEEKCKEILGDEEEEEDEDDYWENLLEDRWTDYSEEVDEEEDHKDKDQDQEEEEPAVQELLSDEEKEQLASEIVATGMTQPWGGVVRGVQSLDQLFGTGHGLLNVDDDDNNVGFGLQDGIWQTSGWRVVPELQRELAHMPELKTLLQSLGRRPTAEASDAIHKFAPRKLYNEGALGAQYDPTQRTSVHGITLSGRLSEMLPSEAVLLAQRRNDVSPDNNNTASTTNTPQSVPSTITNSKKCLPLRRLFLAKLVEHKLQSYESAGWNDVPSIAMSKPKYLERLPSAPGGPIIVCLDTSWSMTGRREQLSKAVVVACVMAAHKQQRDVQVVAFSSARNVMETGPMTATTEGVRRLLEFLSCSFGGGTDVTGALKHVMSVMSSPSSSSVAGGDDQENSDNVDKQKFRRRLSTDLNSMAAADILLITDGEIPDPPVPDTVMEALDRLKDRAGVQVHGLLVGKRSSPPLSKLCTHIHDFLIGYEKAMMIRPSTPSTATTAAAPPFRRGQGTVMAMKTAINQNQQHYYLTRRWTRRKRTVETEGPCTKGWGLIASYKNGLTTNQRCSTFLRARYSVLDDYYDDEDDGWGGRGGRRKRSGGKRGKRLKQPASEDDELDDDAASSTINVASTTTAASSNDDFSTRVEAAKRSLRDSVTASLFDQRWQVHTLDAEKASENSCWQYRGELQAAVERVAEGLIERDEEARLVVLGMVSREHVLFLGPPGTAKSVLGRRLSQLCGGVFFQRLLTRFTTPEEIFGPLSLRALENDEYRRKTEGFLPTASVAFLDEIFKANSAILNTLLTILNERQFDNGAGLREECPIRCVVGASNELPESDELDALYDRFLLRKKVLPVSDQGIMRMLGMDLPGVSPCDNNDESTASGSSVACKTVFSEDLDKLIESISVAADHVTMGEEACALMRDLRTFMREELDVDVSDRRLVKATRLLKVSAACHGRTRVDPLDCLLLQHTMWRLPEEHSAVREWLWNHVTPGSTALTQMTLKDESLESAAVSSVRQFRLLLDGLRQEAILAVGTTLGDVTGKSGGREADVIRIRSLEQEAQRLGDILQDRSSDLARHSELLRRAKDHLWLDPDEAEAAQQLLLPRAHAFHKECNRALEDARALQSALSPLETSLSNDLHLAVIEDLWTEEEDGVSFSEAALSISMKEAKAKYDLETFRKWKRARKKAGY
jgi:MoxR-like ATPase